MKRSLLFGAALVVASLGFAQRAELKSPFQSTTAPEKTLVKNTLPLLVQQQAMGQQYGAKAPRRSAATGTYYTLSGGLYQGFQADGNGYGYSIYEVAPFVNMQAASNGIVGNWHVNGRDTEVYDSEYDYMGYPGYWGYAPTLINQTDSFNIGDNNLYGWYGFNGGASYTSYQAFANGLIGCDSVCTMYPCDDHSLYMYNGRAYSNTQTWGYLDTDNLFGTGGFDNEGTYLTCYGAVQDYKALASPLYVEGLVMKGLSFGTNPVPEGVTLSAIIATEDEYIDTLYCTAEYIEPFVEGSYQRNNKTIYEGNLMFYKTTVDAFGNEAIEPVTIPAGKDFSIYIIGFEQEGVDFGGSGLSIVDEDTNAGLAYNMVSDGEKSYYYGYQSRICLNLGIIGQFDQAYVLTNDDFTDAPEAAVMNALRVSNDGQSCTTEGQAEEDDYNYACIIVGTANPWFDEEGNSNYDIDSDDDTEWISGIAVDNSYYANTSSSLYGYNLLMFTCDALPAGVTGRMAELKVVGRGITSQSFFLLQGDAEIPAGVTTIQVDNSGKNARIFNMAGQRVSDNARGIMIKNGKKFLSK